MTKRPTSLLRFAAGLALLVALSGCATKGYISSVITTGIGLDVSENPQTQIPHVRFGYIRNGVYYIPTGKTDNPSGDASETPNVVSKIHVSSKFLDGITISEKFAVGDLAVDSRGARQLFADVSTESRGVVTQAPLVSAREDRFEAPIERTHVSVKKREPVVLSNRELANKLNRNIKFLNDAGAEAVLAKAKQNTTLASDLEANPFKEGTKKDYLVDLVEMNVVGATDVGRTKLEAWGAIIPKAPK